MIEILIADDHRVFREGIASILDEVEDLTVIGEASNGEEVMTLLDSLTPNVILMDITMGQSSGIPYTKLVKEKFPHIAVLALSMHGESAYIVKMLEAGATGYLLKDAGKLELIRAIRTVAEGNTYFSKQVSAALVEHLTSPAKVLKDKGKVLLTKREIEVLKLIVEEYSNSEIAQQLFISHRTVDTHKRNLLEKLGVKNTAGLVKYAIKNGIIDT